MRCAHTKVIHAVFANAAQRRVRTGAVDEAERDGEAMAGP
jgi:hypothetical protein